MYDISCTRDRSARVFRIIFLARFYGDSGRIRGAKIYENVRLYFSEIYYSRPSTTMLLLFYRSHCTLSTELGHVHYSRFRLRHFVVPTDHIILIGDV